MLRLEKTKFILIVVRAVIKHNTVTQLINELSLKIILLGKQFSINKPTVNHQ